MAVKQIQDSFQCQTCLRYGPIRRSDGQPICQAFLDGIPNDILSGEVSHDRPVAGDGGLTRIPIDDIYRVGT